MKTSSKSIHSFRTAGLVIAASVLAVAIAAPVTAQNLITNPSFDTGLIPWETSGLGLSGTWSFDGSAGNTAPGSAGCTDNQSCIIQQCVDVSGLSHPATMTMSGALTHLGEVTSFARFAIVFPNVTCSGFGQSVSFVETFFPFTGWTTSEDDFTTNADTQGVLVIYSASSGFGGNPIDINFDDAALQAGPDPVIFNSDFESGNLGDWSTVVGQ